MNTMTPEALTTHLKSILIAFDVLSRAIPRQHHSDVQQPFEALMHSYRSMLDQLGVELHALEMVLESMPSEPPAPVPIQVLPPSGLVDVELLRPIYRALATAKLKTSDPVVWETTKDALEALVRVIDGATWQEPESAKAPPKVETVLSAEDRVWLGGLAATLEGADGFVGIGRALSTFLASAKTTPAGE